MMSWAACPTNRRLWSQTPSESKSDRSNILRQVQKRPPLATSLSPNRTKLLHVGRWNGEGLWYQSDRAIGRFHNYHGIVTTQNYYLMARSVVLSFLPPIIMSLLISGPDPTDGWREWALASKLLTFLVAAILIWAELRMFWAIIHLWIFPSRLLLIAAAVFKGIWRKRRSDRRTPITSVSLINEINHHWLAIFSASSYGGSISCRHRYTITYGIVAQMAVQTKENKVIFVLRMVALFARAIGAIIT